MAHDKQGKRLTDEEERVARATLRLMPELPKLFERLAGKLEQFDGTQPKTFIADMEKDVNDFAVRVRGRGRRVGRLLLYLMGKVAARLYARRFIEQVIEPAKRAAMEDERYSLLLKLMHKADEKVPLVSLIVTFAHGDPKEMLVPQSAPMRLLRQAEGTTGEARATAALDAMGKTAEFLYKPYVHTVWALSYIKEVKVPPQPPDLGSLITVAYERLSDYPGLIERDAGWMRNSAVHNLPDYIMEEDSVWMWDRNRVRVKVRVDDLLEMVRRMYLISAVTIQRVGQLYMFREVFYNTGLFDMFVECIPLAVSGDEKRLAAAEQQIMEYGRTLIEPMEKFLDSANR